MERYFKRAGALLVTGALLFSNGAAQQLNRNNIVSGPVEDDAYFVESVLFSGTELPDVLDGTTGTSTYSLEGNGTVTVGSLRSGGFPRMTLFGGTTISATRTYTQENVNHAWWEGAFFAPRLGRTSMRIDGADSPNGEDIARYVVESSLEFGAGNESFGFSPAAKLSVHVGGAVPTNSRLFVATRSADDADVYEINSSKYCWVEDEYCVIDVTEVNAIALVREVFHRCPARNEVAHGSLTGAPNCILACDKGYETDEDRRYCVASEGTDTPEEDFLPSGGEQGGNDPFEPSYDETFFESDIEYPQGYFKYRNSKGNFEREMDVESLSGVDKLRAKKLTAGSLKTVGYNNSGTQVGANNGGENDSFLNYLLSFRGKGGEGETLSAQGVSGSTESSSGNNNNNDDSQTYSSAPLLPSTGVAGIFWVLAALGLGMMAFAVRRK